MKMDKSDRPKSPSVNPPGPPSPPRDFSQKTLSQGSRTSSMESLESISSTKRDKDNGSQHTSNNAARPPSSISVKSIIPPPPPPPPQLMAPPSPMDSMDGLYSDEEEMYDEDDGAAVPPPPVGLFPLPPPPPTLISPTNASSTASSKGGFLPPPPVPPSFVFEAPKTPPPSFAINPPAIPNTASNNNIPDGSSTPPPSFALKAPGTPPPPPFAISAPASPRTAVAVTNVIPSNNNSKDISSKTSTVSLYSPSRGKVVDVIDLSLSTKNVMKKVESKPVEIVDVTETSRNITKKVEEKPVHEVKTSTLPSPSREENKPIVDTFIVKTQELVTKPLSPTSEKIIAPVIGSPATTTTPAVVKKESNMNVQKTIQDSNSTNMDTTKAVPVIDKILKVENTTTDKSLVSTPTNDINKEKASEKVEKDKNTSINAEKETSISKEAPKTVLETPSSTNTNSNVGAVASSIAKSLPSHIRSMSNPPIRSNRSEDTAQVPIINNNTAVTSNTNKSKIEKASVVESNPPSTVIPKNDVSKEKVVETAITSPVVPQSNTSKLTKTSNTNVTDTPTIKNVQQPAATPVQSTNDKKPEMISEAKHVHPDFKSPRKEAVQIFSERLEKLQQSLANGIKPSVNDLMELSKEEMMEYRVLLLQTIRTQRDVLAEKMKVKEETSSKKKKLYFPPETSPAAIATKLALKTLSPRSKSIAPKSFSKKKVDNNGRTISPTKAGTPLAQLSGRLFPEMPITHNHKLMLEREQHTIHLTRKPALPKFSPSSKNTSLWDNANTSPSINDESRSFTQRKNRWASSPTTTASNIKSPTNKSTLFTQKRPVSPSIQEVYTTAHLATVPATTATTIPLPSERPIISSPVTKNTISVTYNQRINKEDSRKQSLQEVEKQYSHEIQKEIHAIAVNLADNRRSRSPKENEKQFTLVDIVMYSKLEPLEGPVFISLTEEKKRKLQSIIEQHGAAQSALLAQREQILQHEKKIVKMRDDMSNVPQHRESRSHGIIDRTNAKRVNSPAKKVSSKTRLDLVSFSSPNGQNDSFILRKLSQKVHDMMTVEQTLFKKYVQLYDEYQSTKQQYIQEYERSKAYSQLLQDNPTKPVLDLHMSKQDEKDISTDRRHSMNTIVVSQLMLNPRINSRTKLMESPSKEDGFTNTNASPSPKRVLQQQQQVNSPYSANIPSPITDMTMTPVVVMGPDGPITMLMTAEGTLVPLPEPLPPPVSLPSTIFPLHHDNEATSISRDLASRAMALQLQEKIHNTVPPKSIKEEEKVDDEPVTIPTGGKLAPESGALGSFMYVRNSRFDPSTGKAPTPDNPQFWVGRVVELMRGGRIRLHWHRETSHGSGYYVPTNNYFPEKSHLLQAFRGVVYDPEKKAWRTHPILETNPPVATNIPHHDDTKTNATDNTNNNTMDEANEIHVGTFVFLRNAKYKPETESPIMPRYWVARITNIATNTNGNGDNMKPIIMTNDGKVRLQWFRETETNSNMFVATSHLFYEFRRLIRILPGNMQLDTAKNVWVRAISTDSDNNTNTANNKNTMEGEKSVLIFPGDDTNVVTTTTLAAAGKNNNTRNTMHSSHSSVGGNMDTMHGENGSTSSSSRYPVIQEEVADCPLLVGEFAFVPNARYNGVDQVTSPKFWVARIRRIIPNAQPQQQQGIPIKIEVQWFIETTVGSSIYKPTTKLFVESSAVLKPLIDVHYDQTSGMLKVNGPFNIKGRFSTSTNGR